MRERDLNILEFGQIAELAAEAAVSEPGRRQLLALRPLTDLDAARRRLRLLAELVELCRRSGAPPLAPFADQRAIFAALAVRDVVLDGQALLALRNFLRCATEVKAFLRARSERLPNLDALVAQLAVPVELAEHLGRALADDATFLDEASVQLGRLRGRLRRQRVGLEARLLRWLDELAVEPLVMDRLVTLRNGRFVAPLKPNYAERVEGIVQDRSASGETFFVEPLWAVALNNRLMLLALEVEAEEYRIRAELTAMAGEHLADLRRTFDALAALDALNALAQFAERLDCSEPELGADVVELIQARHPLLLASGRSPVIPVDIRIGRGRAGIVISGPNTGGKTVALKTLGLLCLMAQAGFLIPARPGSRLPLFNSIMADIGDQQSLQTGLSSFAAHIRNIGEMLASLTEPALLLLDEPGGMTDPVEGAALAIALLQELSRRRCTVAVATHSTEVKLYAYGEGGYQAAAVEFDADRLLPLYRLKADSIGESYGLAIAERLGLPASVIDAARRWLPAAKLEFEQASALLDQRRRELEQKLSELEAANQAVTAQLQALARREEELKAKGRTERARLRAEASALLDELRGESARLSEAIRAGRKPEADARAFLRKAQDRVEAALPPEAPAAPQQPPFSVGDYVRVGGLTGRLLAVRGPYATLARGAMRIEVAADRLERAEPPRASKTTPSVRVLADTQGSDLEEISLIGLRTDEALHKLGQFLDRAYLAGSAQVRIVHGVGTGALAKAVHDYLGKSPYCVGFRNADPHQGGPGATVADLDV